MLNHLILARGATTPAKPAVATTGAWATFNRYWEAVFGR